MLQLGLKKILSCVCITCMCFSLVACGKEVKGSEVPVLNSSESASVEESVESLDTHSYSVAMNLVSANNDIGSAEQEVAEGNLRKEAAKDIQIPTEIVENLQDFGGVSYSVIGVDAPTEDIDDIVVHIRVDDWDLQGLDDYALHSIAVNGIMQTDLNYDVNEGDSGNTDEELWFDYTYTLNSLELKAAGITSIDWITLIFVDSNWNYESIDLAITEDAYYLNNNEPTELYSVLDGNYGSVDLVSVSPADENGVAGFASTVVKVTNTTSDVLDFDVGFYFIEQGYEDYEQLGNSDYVTLFPGYTCYIQTTHQTETFMAPGSKIVSMGVDAAIESPWTEGKESTIYDTDYAIFNEENI